MHVRLEWNNGPPAQSVGKKLSTHQGANPGKGISEAPGSSAAQKRWPSFATPKHRATTRPGDLDGVEGGRKDFPPTTPQRPRYPSTPADRGRASKEGGCGFVLGSLYIGPEGVVQNFIICEWVDKVTCRNGCLGCAGCPEVFGLQTMARLGFCVEDNCWNLNLERHRTKLNKPNLQK